MNQIKKKINSLKSFIKKLGYNINNQNKNLLSKSINNLLKEVNNTPEKNMIETLTIRSMSKAIYSSKNIGHYGLGFSCYTHFTSPIRRYPDLIVHRLLYECFNEKEIFQIILLILFVNTHLKKKRMLH